MITVAIVSLLWKKQMQEEEGAKNGCTEPLAASPALPFLQSLSSPPKKKTAAWEMAPELELWA